MYRTVQLSFEKHCISYSRHCCASTRVSIATSSQTVSVELCPTIYWCHSCLRLKTKVYRTLCRPVSLKKVIYTLSDSVGQVLSQTDEALLTQNIRIRGNSELSIQWYQNLGTDLESTAISLLFNIRRPSSFNFIPSAIRYPVSPLTIIRKSLHPTMVLYPSFHYPTCLRFLCEKKTAGLFQMSPSDYLFINTCQQFSGIDFYRRW